MRKFVLILLTLVLAVSSACASSLDFTGALQDTLIEHRVFLTDDAEDYAEITTFFYGHDTHIIYQVNVENLFDKTKYTLEQMQSLDMDQIIPGFSSLPFASATIEETDKYLAVVVTFANLNDPETFKLALQNEIFTGNFPDNYATMESLSDSITGRELTMTEYGQLGLHFDIK